MISCCGCYASVDSSGVYPYDTKELFCFLAIKEVGNCELCLDLQCGFLDVNEPYFYFACNRNLVLSLLSDILFLSC